MITLIIYIRTTDTQWDWMIFHFEEERDTVCVQKVWTITDNFFFYQNETYCIIISKCLCFFNYINHYQNWNVEIKHIAYVSKLESFTPFKKNGIHFWNTLSNKKNKFMNYDVVDHISRLSNCNQITTCWWRLSINHNSWKAGAKNAMPSLQISAIQLKFLGEPSYSAI